MRNMKEALHELQGKIGYQFQDETLLKQALTHSSFANEQKINKLNNYERLEFLGDAVLELVSSEFLYNENEDMPEGQLTRLRASMVCEPALAYCARDIQLNTYILLGKGEESTGGRKRDSITSDVMEDKILFMDSKTLLQEEIQKKNTSQLRYELVGEEGPDHDKQFSVEVYLDEHLIGSGVGRTKKAAEQQAAYEALKKLKGRK